MQHIQLCSLILGVLEVNFLSLIAVEAFHPQLSHVVRMSWEYSVEVTVMLLLSIAHKNVHAGAFRNLLVGVVKANVCAVCCGSAIFSSKLLYMSLLQSPVSLFSGYS